MIEDRNYVNEGMVAQNEKRKGTYKESCKCLGCLAPRPGQMRALGWAFDDQLMMKSLYCD